MPFAIGGPLELSLYLFNGFRGICIQVYLGHDLDLLRSRDVIGHVTI